MNRLGPSVSDSLIPAIKKPKLSLGFFSSIIYQNPDKSN